MDKELQLIPRVAFVPGTLRYEMMVAGLNAGGWLLTGPQQYMLNVGLARAQMIHNIPYGMLGYMPAGVGVRLSIADIQLLQVVAQRSVWRHSVTQAKQWAKNMQAALIKPTQVFPELLTTTPVVTSVGGPPAMGTLVCTANLQIVTGETGDKRVIVILPPGDTPETNCVSKVIKAYREDNKQVVRKVLTKKKVKKKAVRKKRK